MNFEEIKERLLMYSIDFELIFHEVAIKSKHDAQGLFEINETAPTLILKTDVGFFAFVISGEREKINFKDLKRLLGCKKLEMAPKEEIVERFGFEAGQVPMLGHNLPCIFDNLLLKYKYVYGGTGNWNYTLKISPNDIIKANNVILQID